MSYEKRIYKRIKEKIHLTYRVIQVGQGQNFSPKDHGEGDSQDISAGGLLFTTRDPIPLGTRLELEIRFPDVRYVRLEEFNDGEYYEVGLEFNQIFENDKALLMQHMSKHAID